MVPTEMETNLVLTLDLLESLFVEATDMAQFLLQILKTPCERICYLQLLVVGAAPLRIVDGCLHLPYSSDDLLGFLDHVMFL